MPEDDDTIEAIRLARVLVEKLDALGEQFDAMRSILRDDATPEEVGGEN